jgi:hypothetical protein
VESWETKMLHTWPRRRRGITDSLDTVNAPRWLVFRDRLSRVLEYRPLGPGADLRAALKAKGTVQAAEGWKIGNTLATAASSASAGASVWITSSPAARQSVMADR